MGVFGFQSAIASLRLALFVILGQVSFVSFVCFLTLHCGVHLAEFVVHWRHRHTRRWVL